MRSFTTIELQYAHRFYGFQGEAQYLHGHTGVLTLEVEDTINKGVNGASQEYEPGEEKDRCPMCGVKMTVKENAYYE